mgnify:CR=1 FL=1
MFGNPETTTGGRALKFYSSIRLDVRPEPSSVLESAGVKLYFSRTLFSVSDNKSGCSLKYCFAFSLPCPILVLL